MFSQHEFVVFSVSVFVVQRMLGSVGESVDMFRLQVFALGNKTYEHYNAMGKYVDKKLVELGARRIFDLGMGDDDGK